MRLLECSPLNPKVSVIVPVYNVEDYLSRCLDSILNQGLRDLEVIAVNDGSTDRSADILEKYAAQDDRVVVVHRSNGGLSAARNTGLDCAKGDFIAFVDSDDWIDEDMLLEMTALSEKHQADLAFCSLNKVNENNEVFRVLEEGKNREECIDLYKDFSIFGEMSWFACNKVFRKGILEDFRFLEGVHFEDIASVPLLFLKCEKICVSPNPYYQYFERQGSITRNYNERGMDILKAVERVSAEFEKSKFSSNKKELKRFQIFNGYISFLAYAAQVRDKNIRRKMLNDLQQRINLWGIQKKDIQMFRKNGVLFIRSLPFKKQLYYWLHRNLPIILKFI